MSKLEDNVNDILGIDKKTEVKVKKDFTNVKNEDISKIIHNKFIIKCKFMKKKN